MGSRWSGPSSAVAAPLTPSGLRAALTPAATCGQSAVALGSASSYAALSGTGVTSTGATSLTGDVGVSPGTSVTGFPPGTYTGTKNVGNTASAAAEAALTVAYNDAAGRSNCAVTVAGNIGGQTLTPGLYKSTSSLAISSGDLTLSGGGNPNGIFVFQVASAFTTTSGRAVVLSNGAQAGNVFWQIGSSATIGTTSTVQGTLLAYASISMLSGSHLNGRALARTGDVTLSATAIVVPTTSSAATYPVTFTEAGLTAGTSWSVTFNGVLASSTTTTLDFTVVAGSYAFGLGAVAGFIPSPASGTTTVTNAPVSQTITFTAGTPATYSITFSETGLASGTSWSVTFNGVLKSSTTATVVFTGSDGTNGYSVGASTGYDSNPSFGSVTVNGAAVGQAITFTSSSGTGGGPGPSTPGGASAGTPTWMWALLGIAVLAILAAVIAGALLMRRRKQAQ